MLKVLQLHILFIDVITNLHKVDLADALLEEKLEKERATFGLHGFGAVAELQSSAQHNIVHKCLVIQSLVIIGEVHEQVICMKPN